MIRHKYIYIALAAGLLLTTSCEKWLDVEPKSQVKAKELFETEEGFKEALAGVYTMAIRREPPVTLRMHMLGHVSRKMVACTASTWVLCVNGAIPVNLTSSRLCVSIISTPPRKLGGASNSNPHRKQGTA